MPGNEIDTLDSDDYDGFDTSDQSESNDGVYIDLDDDN